MFGIVDILKKLIDLAVYKSKKGVFNLLLMSVIGGMFISLAGQLYVLSITGLSDHIGLGLSKIIGGLVFSIGLILVIFLGAELFTGNCLTLPLGNLSKKVSIKSTAINWSVVFLGNLVGSLLFVFLIYFSGINGAGTPNAIGENFIHIAFAKVSLTEVQIFIKAIFANWLVCLAVMMGQSSQDGMSKAISISLPVMAFVALGGEHSIANMYLLPMGSILSVGTENAITMSLIVRNISIATLGNIVGAVVFLALPYFFAYKKQIDS
jgi:formate/nitrite transporter